MIAASCVGDSYSLATPLLRFLVVELPSALVLYVPMMAECRDDLVHSGLDRLLPGIGLGLPP